MESPTKNIHKLFRNRKLLSTVLIGAGIAGYLNLAFARANSAPTVTISSTILTTTDVSPLPLKATFDKAVKGFDDKDITVLNGKVGGFRPDLMTSPVGSVYYFNVTPSGQGPVTVDIPENAAFDEANNANEASAQYMAIYDSVAPVITSAETFDTNGDGTMDRIMLTFDEPLNDSDMASNGFDVTSALDHGSCDSEMADPDGSNLLQLDFVCTDKDTAVDDLTLSLTSNPGVADFAGNQVAGVTLNAESTPPITDGAAPIVVSTTPAEGDVDVPSGEAALVKFSEPMDPQTVTLSDNGNSNFTRTTWSDSDKTANYRHGDWNLNSPVTVQIEGKDKNGFSLNPEVRVSLGFTTGSTQTGTSIGNGKVLGVSTTRFDQLVGRMINEILAVLQWLS